MYLDFSGKCQIASLTDIWVPTYENMWDTGIKILQYKNLLDYLLNPEN